VSARTLVGMDGLMRDSRRALPNGREQKRERQRVIRELVTRGPVGSQSELVELLSARGFDVTQATVSRDIGELGLVKVARGGRHLYALPEDLARDVPARDDVLRRLLADLPVEIRRSGLILLLISTPGAASALAEAIDRSTLDEQEGTLAGDNTVLVLFADEPRLVRWRARLEALREGSGGRGRARVRGERT
jgi:transcriptional regulator of arginine metabolism